MAEKTRKVEVRMSEDEHEYLMAKAKKAGLNASTFIRLAVANVKIYEYPPVDVPRLIREVRRVGNNINQILVIARTNGLLNVSEIEKALEDNRAVEKMISSAYERPWQ